MKQKSGWEPVPWYIRFLLLFKKRYYATDLAYGEDYTVTVVSKRLFGRVYIIDNKVIPMTIGTLHKESHE